MQNPILGLSCVENFQSMHLLDRMKGNRTKRILTVSIQAFIEVHDYVRALSEKSETKTYGSILDGFKTGSN